MEYDENAPCVYCGLPVVEASMGGTVVCPWCDFGNHRDGRKWTLAETFQMFENAKRASDSASARHGQSAEEEA